jgi:hypothetical protein
MMGHNITFEATLTCSSGFLPVFFEKKSKLLAKIENSALH